MNFEIPEREQMTMLEQRMRDAAKTLFAETRELMRLHPGTPEYEAQEARCQAASERALAATDLWLKHEATLWQQLQFLLANCVGYLGHPLFTAVQWVRKVMTRSKR